MPDNPDPDQDQFNVIKSFVVENKQIEYIWFDCRVAPGLQVTLASAALIVCVHALCVCATDTCMPQNACGYKKTEEQKLEFKRMLAQVSRG